MTYYVPRRRSGGKDRDRLGCKVFSYFTDEERDRLSEAARKSDSSISSFVAKAANAAARKVLDESVPIPNEPLSCEDIVRALKNKVPTTEIASLVTNNRITFSMSDKQEERLRNAGATDGLLLQIYKLGRNGGK